MSELRAWFVANRPIIVFMYGQVFFVMGIAIVLQSRRYSRLELARSLPWLAAFGILHGLNEWGDLFIPIQTAFLPDPLIHFLRAGQSILLAASFACLLQFGVELLRPLPERYRQLRLLPGAILFAWLIGPFWIGLQLIPNLDDWNSIVDALARYFIGFPGGLLAAYALRRHARWRIAPLGLPSIYNTLRLAGLALAAYAIVGGLIVRAAPFFPANVFNSAWVTDALIVPPQVLRSLAGTVLAIAIIRALEVFQVETDQLIEQMEEAQVVAIERERIGRDLHDGAIQRVYAAGLLAESLRKKTDGPVADGLDRLMMTLNDAIADLRHFLSDLNSRDSTTDLNAVVTSLVDEARHASGAEVRWTPVTLSGLPPDRVTHLAAFAREALSNAVRHSQARVIEVKAIGADNHLQLIIRDDGRGFKPDALRGYGLRNMRDRARLLGGEVTIDSKPGKGTGVTLDIPLERDA
jgi:signal transduction histidine kinase